MKPCKYKTKHCSSKLQTLSVGPIITSIHGTTKKLGKKYENALIVLFNKINLQPIAVTRPDPNGDYQFLGLNTDLKTFVVAFDQKQQYNAVIQDNVVPK